jgi:hypothetical protein
MNGLMAGGKIGAERAPLRLGSIEITEDGIAECTREGHRSVFVPRADIERVTLGYGFTSERPVATLLGAAVFLGGAAVVFWRVFSALNGRYLGTKFRILTIGLLFTVVGAMFLWTLVQRGRYLRVDTARDSRKLLLRREAPAAVRELLHLARSRFGYTIDMSPLEDA